ncbi:hypothetical protein PSPO01_00227 [Paraphaeosphaeria sporulosa]
MFITPAHSILTRSINQPKKRDRNMHHLRDTLLSPSPKGPPELSMAGDTVRDQQDTRECIAHGELEEVRGAAFYHRTSIVTGRYAISETE